MGCKSTWACDYIGAFMVEAVTSRKRKWVRWIVVAFALIVVGTYLYTWLLSGIWLNWFKKDKPEAAA